MSKSAARRHRDGPVSRIPSDDAPVNLTGAAEKKDGRAAAGLRGRGPRTGGPVAGTARAAAAPLPQRTGPARPGLRCSHSEVGPVVAAGVAGGRVGGTESNLAVQLKCYRNARSSNSRVRERRRRARPAGGHPSAALALLCLRLHCSPHRPSSVAPLSPYTPSHIDRPAWPTPLSEPRCACAGSHARGPTRRALASTALGAGGGGGEPGPERRPTIGATMLRRRCFGGGRLSWAQRSPCGNGGGRRPPTASPPTARPVPSVQRLRTTPPRRGGRTCPAVRRQRRASSPRRSAPAGPKWTRTALPPAHALAAPNWHTGTASRGAPPDEGRAAPAVVTRRPALAAPSPECTVLLAYPAPQPRPRSPVFPRQTP